LGEYDILINKKPHRVRLAYLDERTIFEVEVNGKSIKVELSEGISFDKPFLIKVDGKHHRVELSRREIVGSVSVKVDDASYSAQLENKNRIISTALRPALPTLEKKFSKAQAMEKGVIVASMPGRVVLLRAKAGDSVRVGDVLLVLEAMKMENEIVSPINGFVKDVKVSEGSAVNIGEIMVVVDQKR